MTRRPTHAVTVEVPARSIFAYSFPLFLNSVVITAIAQLDVMLLGAFYGTRTVALYSPINRLTAWPTTAFGFAGAYLLPQLTQAIALGDRPAVASLYHGASRWGWVLAVPFVGPLLATPSAVLSVLFGNRYADLSAPTRVLTMAALLSILAGFNAAAVDAHGNPKRVAIRSGIALAVSVAACFALVPHFGMMGGAWATVIGIGTLNLLNSSVLAIQYRIWPWDRALSLIGLTGAATIAVVYLVAPLIPWLFGRCVLAAVLPALTCITVLLLAVDNEERHLLLGRLPWVGKRFAPVARP
jgi:O-antigen/teichoic acid export membrane protein